MPAFNFVLAGRYKLVAPLGEGGMAAVYRGRDLRLNRDIAIKVLHDELTRDPEFLVRFQREAEFVASLSHPNIVPVYDVGEEQGTHFIVMEYVRGRTLKEAIELEGRIPPDRAVGIVRRVLEALGYAHKQGLVHRDVKPQNILLTPDGTPRLADFGIAHLVGGSTTRTAAILGSAHYLSPEQSRGEEATCRSDIYACGVVLYEMLSGHPPFDGPNALAIANQHLQTPPTPLRGAVAGVEALDRAVMRALAKDPEARFEDAGAFVAALESSGTSLDHTFAQPLAGPPAQLQGAPPESPKVSAGHPATRPSGADDTFSRPLAGPAGDEATEPSARPVARHGGREIMVRRSTRKSYLLAMALLAAVAAAAYAASTLSVSGHPLPRYPSAPYALLPALLTAFVMFSWFRARSRVYVLNDNAAVVQWGVLAHHRFGVPLRHVFSLKLKQSPIDRLLGVGTVELWTRDGDGSERCLVMEDVPHPRQTYEELTRFMGQAARAHISRRVERQD